MINLVIFLVLGMVLSSLVLCWGAAAVGSPFALLCTLDLAPTHLGGLSPDLRPRRIPPGPGCRRRGWSRRWSGMPPASGGWSGSAFPSSPVSYRSWRRRSGGQTGSRRGARGAAAAAAGFPQRPLDRAGHGGSRHLSLTATIVPPARRSMSWRTQASASTACRRPRRGRCHPMRACLLDDGLTSSPPAGSRRSTGRYPTLAEFLGSRATRRPASSPTTWYCASDSGLARGFAAYQRLHFPAAPRPQDGRPGRSPPGWAPGDRGFPRGLAGFRSPGSGGAITSGGSSRPIERRRRWSIASSSTGCPAAAAGAAVLRLLELL